MASAAVGTELSVMDVVARVTIAAPSAEPYLQFQGLPVAGIAFHGTVRTVENKCGLRVVVEAPLGPVDR